ncbi:MAG: Gfo/Idh/MocA family oxidoreductase [Planctomycetia bacterium]|nr:Gfo/Idh/MocA family oxidoreductase [Planctomycetia bacterium]
MSSPRRVPRRDFLATAAIATAAPFAASRSVIAAPKTPVANERLTLGFIGMGKQSRGHLQWALNNPQTEVVAVCDVHDLRLEDAAVAVGKKYGERKKSGSAVTCASYRDFRKLLARDDIDGVVISTPDHWHAIPSILAARAKKHVYCEKPLSLTISESRAMVAAARENKIVFQTGSQQRTEFGGVFRKAVEYVRSGRIGRVKTVRVGVGAPAKPCDLAEEPTPKGIDWNLWNGPSPERGFSHILCPLDVHNHFPQFRLYREYACGMLADMGAHHFDIAQWALNKDGTGPVEIHPPEQGETGLRFVYADGVEMFHGGPSGCTFEGTEGTIYVDRKGIESTPKSILETPLGEKDFHLPDVGGNHKQNWLDCIRTGEKPVADVEIGARTAQVCQLANIGYQLRRSLKWNPDREEFLDDAEANRLRSRENRSPWNEI